MRSPCPIQSLSLSLSFLTELLKRENLASKTEFITNSSLSFYLFPFEFPPLSFYFDCKTFYLPLSLFLLSSSSSPNNRFPRNDRKLTPTSSNSFLSFLHVLWFFRLFFFSLFFNTS